MNFGKWVECKLETVKKSSYQLEIDADLSKGTIYRWTADRANPRLDTFIKAVRQIAEYSGESLDSLLIEAMQNTREYNDK